MASDTMVRGLQATSALSSACGHKPWLPPYTQQGVTPKALLPHKATSTRPSFLLQSSKNMKNP